MRPAQHLDLDIWRSSSTSLDLRLSPHELPVLRSHLPSSADAEVFIPSLQPLIDATYPSHPFRSDAWNVSSLDSSFYDHFHTVEELYAFGDELAVQFPGVVEGFDVGQTFEGREIRGWRAHLADNSSLSGGEGGDERKAKKGRKGEVQEKPILEFVVQSGQHAREVGRSGPPMSFMLNRIVDRANDSDVLLTLPCPRRHFRTQWRHCPASPLIHLCRRPTHQPGRFRLLPAVQQAVAEEQAAHRFAEMSRRRP